MAHDRFMGLSPERVNGGYLSRAGPKQGGFRLSSLAQRAAGRDCYAPEPDGRRLEEVCRDRHKRKLFDDLVGERPPTSPGNQQRARMRLIDTDGPSRVS